MGNKNDNLSLSKKFGLTKKIFLSFASLAPMILAIAPIAIFPNFANAQSALKNYKQRAPHEEVTYFLLPDRFENGDKANDKGGLVGDRLQTGFDPTSKGYFHGGDLKGLTARLDYIQNLGASAIWLAPIFKNKPVQGPKGDESAAYHGYWVNDFTTIDPHFGTEQEFKAFVDAAHKRNMKVYMDIIANHSSDVIFYKECIGKNDCPYMNESDYPKTPYTAFIPAGEENIKKPQWLNDPKYYFNRGNSAWWGESSKKGDFSGLDDIDATNPRVISGFIDIFGTWIDKYKIDGFRIDTVKHVDAVFWQKFIPAIKARALKNGIPNFHIFGEVYIEGVNPGALAIYTKRDKLPSVLDFSFQTAVRNVLGKNAPTDIFYELYDGDILYEGGEKGAMKLQTFVSNHDMGRLAMLLRSDMPNISNDELLARVKLGNALMLSTRGSPTIYSGDEQGFVGDGRDQDSREDMFPSQTAVYNDNVLLGTNDTNAISNFNQNHILFKQISQLAKIRSQNNALVEGRQLIRKTSNSSGIFAMSRFDKQGNEIVLAFNTSNKTINENIKTNQKSKKWQSLSGNCASLSNADGIISLELAPLDYAICKVDK
jgi:neopullulanase